MRVEREVAVMRTSGRAKNGHRKLLVGGGSRLPADAKEDATRRRQLLAELCRVIGAHVGGENGRPSVADGLKLSPRLRQTLEALTQGDSEKQIAAKLKVSPHTVHVYVKQLYKRFHVSSRGELLALFVRGNALSKAPAAP